MDQVTRRERNSTVELLRLLAMLMVVANHFATHGGISLNVTGSEVTGKLFFSQMLACLGKLGVDVFVIISAWYLYGRPLTVRRILSLWLPVWFWGLVIYAVAPGLGIRCGLNEFLLSAFPLTHNAYWFVTDLFVKWVDVPALYRSDNYYCRAIVAIVVVYFVSMLLSLVYVSLTRFVKRTQHKK